MATYSELKAILATVPGADPVWAEPLYTAGLTSEALRALLDTMSVERGSPLREAGEGVLSKEIMRLNASMGTPQDDVGNGRLRVKLRSVLSAAEQARVVKLVGHFCQPEFVSRAKFAKTNHSVMNATRRAVTAYHYSRVVAGARVLEVGPDMANYVSSEQTDRFASQGVHYVGSRVPIGPRDVVRMQWGEFAERMAAQGVLSRTEPRHEKAQALLDGKLHVEKKVGDIVEPVDGIVSTDSNYDVEFHSMPAVMARTRARWWYGTMSRAKNLSATTKLTAGRAELGGVTWRVDWRSRRIDFRHPNCTAFGYSHAVDSYAMYEESNGYVWHGPDASYVYTKGPETNDELLFFSVHRVASAIGMIEPTFVEHPQAGKMKLKSVWATGDEVSGVPRRFSAVEFHVDRLNFSKVLEKRRALDHKGDWAVTLNLVRSTNVTFFLNGTPVGASTKIAANLSEATAVVVEALAGQQRVAVNDAFFAAMQQHTISVKRDPWVLRMLESFLDVRAMVGSVVSTLTDAWSSMRQPLVSAALADISEIRVSAEVEVEHVQVPRQEAKYVVPAMRPLCELDCFCDEVRRLRVVAVEGVQVARVKAMMRLREFSQMVCRCRSQEVAAVESYGCEDEVTDVSADTESTSGTSVVSSSRGSLPTTVSSVAEEPVGKTWQSDALRESVETLAMEEVIEISRQQVIATLSECRIDAGKIFAMGITERNVRYHDTTRTTHACVEFYRGRSVTTIGALKERVSAVYSVGADSVIPVQDRNGVYVGSVPDGWYYTCSRLQVWNHAEISGAMQYALDHGVVGTRRCDYEVFLGVPGSGKTYRALEYLAPHLMERPNDVLYLGATKASVASAVKEALARGVPRKVAEARCITLDSYLCNRKSPAKILVGDEAPATHIGKFDAAVSLSGARVVKLYGDAKQVEYNPFVAGFVVAHSAPGDTIPERNYTFYGETHRCGERVCAAWLHAYPYFYPCECHVTDEKLRSSMTAEHIDNVSAVEYDPKVRYHTFKQDEKEDLRTALPFGADSTTLRARHPGGLSTVHEDQGSTHHRVVSVRLHAEYDKNSSANPTLYNKENYALSDTTRHTGTYRYLSVSTEEDAVVKAVKRSSDPALLAAVREKRGIADVSLQSLWA